jgi:hypothetical protein
VCVQKGWLNGELRNITTESDKYLYENSEDWIEIKTDEELSYVKNRLDGCRFGKPNNNDLFKPNFDGSKRFLYGYRWIKIPEQKKKPVYVEYPIFVSKDRTLGYRCEIKHMKSLVEIPLHKLPSLVGFAGVQFEGQNDNKLWNVELSLFINEEGGLCSLCMDGEHKPATPIKARFLVEEKK